MMFDKTVCGDFDQIRIKGDQDSDWLTLTMRVGYTDQEVRMVLRSEEAVRNLHYGLGRYLAKLSPANHLNQ